MSTANTDPGCPRYRGHPAPRNPRAVRRLAALLLIAATAVLAVIPAANASADSRPTTSAAALPAAPAPVPAPNPSPSVPGIGLGPGAPTDPVTAPPPATGPGTTSGSGDDPSWYDIPGQIKKAIDDFFAGLVKDALNPVLSLIGNTVLATPDVTTMARVGQIWTSMAVLANSLYVLFILAGAAVIMSHETLQTRYAAKQIIPRLIVGFIAGNASLAMLGLVIHVADSLSSGIMGQGLDPKQAGTALANMITGSITHAGGGIFLAILGLGVAGMAIALLITYIVRVALIVILAVSAPMALACHALPQTDGLARLWWRAVIGTLAVQVAQSLTLIVALQVMLDPGGQTGLGIPTGGGLVDLLVFLALFWILIKIPSWIGRTVFAGAPNSAMSIAKEVVVYKALGAVGQMLKRAPKKVPAPVTTNRPTGSALALRATGAGGGGGFGSRPGGGAGPAVYTVTRVPGPSGASPASRAHPGAGPRLAIAAGPGGSPGSGGSMPALGPGPRGRRASVISGEVLDGARGPFPMPAAVQDRLAARQRATAEAPKPRYVQNGLFPPMAREARPALASTTTAIPGPPPARSGVRNQALFTRAGEPTAAALPTVNTAPRPAPISAPRAAPRAAAPPSVTPAPSTGAAPRMTAAPAPATRRPTTAPSTPTPRASGPKGSTR